MKNSHPGHRTRIDFSVSVSKNHITRLIKSALFGLIVFSTMTPPAEATLETTFVDSAFVTSSSSPGAQYDFASVSRFLDPALTSWVAWNNVATVALSNAGCSAFAGGAAGKCLGPGGFGTDDFIQLTVVNPLSVSLTVNLDQNTALGNSSGQQNVIFGTASAAPDAIRTSPFFGSPPSVTTIFNEAGAFNSIFTIAGTYIFNFSFRNSFTNSAGHQDIYLLAETAQPSTSVPEPATLLLLAIGLLALACWRSRTAVH